MICMYKYIRDSTSSSDTPPRGIETAKKSLPVIADESRPINVPDK